MSFLLHVPRLLAQAHAALGMPHSLTAISVFMLHCECLTHLLATLRQCT
jgi:hypothetical protein